MWQPGRCDAFCHLCRFEGASSGIGAATAVLFSKLGASLVLNGRNEKGLDETIGNCDESSRNKVGLINLNVYPLVKFLSFNSNHEDRQGRR